MRRKVQLLRGLAILAVLVGHAALWAIEPLAPARGVPLALEPWPLWQYHFLGAAAELSYFAVPAFFFGAGLFASYAIHEPGLHENAAFLGARVKGLLRPLLFWSVVSFGVTWALGIPSMSAYLLNRLALGQIEWGYFFPLAVLQMYLLAPLLVDQARRRPVRLLVVAFAVQGLALAARMAGSVWGFLETVPTLGAGAGNYALWRWLAYIACGVVAGLHSTAIERFLSPRRHRLAGLALVSAGLMLAEGRLLAEGLDEPGWIASQIRPGAVLYALSCLALFFSVTISPTPATRFIESAGGVSFGLLLLHPVCFRVLHHVLVLRAPELVRAQPVAAASIYLLVGGVPCVWMMTRLFQSRHRAFAATVFGH